MIKMKIWVYLVMITNLLVSCKGGNDYASTHSARLSYVNFSAETVSYHLLAGFRERQHQLTNQQEMKKQGYLFERLDSCDSGPPPLVDPDLLKKYPRGTPFNMVKKYLPGQIRVEFEFIKDCCLEHVGKIRRNSPTLYLYYANISETPCDCYCIYKYRFIVDTQGDVYTHIVVVNT
jgi:hypothetical protein